MPANRSKGLTTCEIAAHLRPTPAFHLTPVRCAATRATYRCCCLPLGAVMTTPRDLLMVAVEMESRRPEQGDLSLALAGAEVIDLLGAQAIRLDDERIVPVHRPATGDRLLDEAASSLVRQEPYESVGDWLWRRGRGLFSSYLAALEAEGQATRQRRRWRPFRTGRTMRVDSPAHREAAKRWTSDDAVLAALAAAVGIHDERTAD